jgi:hypothetical protein
MRWQVKTYPIFTWALVTGALALWHGWGVGTTLVFATFFIVPYLLWALYSQNIQKRQLLRGLQPSNKRLTLQPDITSVALGNNPVILWLMEIGSLAFVVAGMFMLVVDSSKWLIAVVSIVFSGSARSFLRTC